MNYEQAAAVPVRALTALRFLSESQILPRERALVYDASGSVGSYAVQLAKDFGSYVTGLCSTANLEWIQGLGAEQVIDYTVMEIDLRDQMNG